MRIAAAFAVAALAAVCFAGDPPQPAGVEKTAHFEIRFRPGSRAAASVDRAAAMAERDLARICELLKIKVDGKYVLSLYDDVSELQAQTKTSDNGGFSRGNASYLPWDNDQTRFHELVHLVAAQVLKKSGDEPRNMFFADGLANALLEFVHGVHVHAVARYYDKAGKLPPLADMAHCSDFYGWMRDRPGFDAYDVAASWFRFLLDAYGAEKTVRYYTGTPAKAAFGVAEAELEKQWRKAVAAFPLRPEVEALLAARLGGAGAGVTELLAQGNGWTQLVPTAGPGEWKREGNALVGTSATAEWSVCELGTEQYRDCIVRAHVRTPQSCALQVRLGPGNRAMLVNGTFVYRGDKPFAFTQSPQMDPQRKETDFVLVRRGGVLEVWIDGAKALSCEASNEPAPVGIGVCGGTAVFDDVRVRALE